jgi:beta-glucosidase
MQNMKLLKSLLWTAVGCLCLSACSLPAPGAPDGGGTMPIACALTAGDAGAVDAVSTVMATGDIENVVTPMACQANPNGNTIDIYSQGYSYTDPTILMKVDQTMNSISVGDEQLQMTGMPYGGSSPQYSNIQRSQDTATIRGYRFRDASRGMNLGEDMSGSFPNAAVVLGQHVGYSTSFPVSMARGAAFDLDLESAVGEAIGDEMQAAHETLLLAPCMNLLRHPYWGRAQETYGEDSYHVGRLASAMVVGIQQHIAANAKHFMGYDVEAARSNNDSEMDEQTLREIYGRHFRMVVQDSGVASAMASYNSVNGVKSTINEHTLTDVLRNDFGFKGFILSDWWAMPGYENIPDTSTQTSNAIKAINAGLDIELPWALNYSQLQSLTSTGTVKKAQLDAAVRRILYEKYRFNSDPLTGTVGLKAPVTIYDPTKGVITCDATHLALAKRAAVESMVLLKNKGVLPISPTVKNIAVVGATVPYYLYQSPTPTGSVNFATDVRGGDLGSSRVYPDPAKSVGPFAGICVASGGTVSASGTSCTGASVNVTTATNNAGDLSPVTSAVSAADFVVVMAGLTPQDEGEEYTFAADRNTKCVNLSACLSLDAKQATSTYQGIQNNLIKMVAASGKPMVVVLEGGSVIDMSAWLSSVPAVVMAWYPGQRGGEALGDLLWGEVGGVSYNFGGKLPITWGHESDYGDPFSDTSNGGKTTFDYYIGYRYFDHNGIAPEFPFGAGLSYTTFALSNLQLGCSSMIQGSVLPVVVNITNTGTVAGDDTVMVFVSFPNTTVARRMGQKELKGFARVSLAPGEAKQVTIPVRLSDLDYFQPDSSTASTGHWAVEGGPISIMVTDGSQNSDGTTSFPPSLTGTVNVTSGFTVGPPQ